MPPGVHPMLLEGFRQGDGSRTRGHDGTVVGPDLRSSLAAPMHARIGYQSKEGEGRLFRLTMPCEPSQGTA